MSIITPRSVQPIHEAKFVNDLPYLRVESELDAHVQKPSITPTAEQEHENVTELVLVTLVDGVEEGRRFSNEEKDPMQVELYGI